MSVLAIQLLLTVWCCVVVVLLCCVQFPLTLFMMTGSQADRADKNKVTIIKLSDISKTQKSPGVMDVCFLTM
jgi:hypothetical protein